MRQRAADIAKRRHERNAGGRSDDRIDLISAATDLGRGHVALTPVTQCLRAIMVRVIMVRVIMVRVIMVRVISAPGIPHPPDRGIPGKMIGDGGGQTSRPLCLS